MKGIFKERNERSKLYYLKKNS